MREKATNPTLSSSFKSLGSRKITAKSLLPKPGEKIIAGSYYRFCPGGVIEYAANNSLPEFQKLKPNDLLGWHSIRWACDAGFEFYSMGGSHLFLRRFGGETRPTYRYKMDLTKLKIHNIKEAVTDFSIKTYKSLPQPLKTKIKAVLGRD